MSMDCKHNWSERSACAALGAGINEGGHYFRYFGPSGVRALPLVLAETKVATIVGILVRAALCRRCLTAVGHYFR